ncbi:MAG: hypothetical protein NT003_04775, partial [Candidatus Magasanikbacteria bacterium]|nr:hypothetical protein [Candidatus Magasanikbacteria bacterium]
YVRYWLPIFVFATPFIAWLFVKILEKKNFNDDHARLYARIFVGIFVALGFWRAIIGVDGLNAVAAEVRSGRVIVRQVEAQVPQNAVLAVRTWDKHFFPDRAILQPFPSDVRALAAVKELRSKGVAVYAFIEALTPTDENWLRDNGLVASMINVYGTQRLYALNIWTRE